MSNLNAESIFHEALKISNESERNAYLHGACGNDIALRNKVEALLDADADAGSFMENTATKNFHFDDHRIDTIKNQSEGSGKQIDKYKLLQKIGEGGFGTVWMAEQNEPVKRRVALKIIKLGMDTKQVIARFEAERQALAMMDHPNIAKVLDAGSTETGRPYFVMELVKGIPILEYCDNEKLETNSRLNLFIKVCNAIQHAHQKGIIHRDIKPSNVLVTLHDSVPVPKVIDFGIAKATSIELTNKTLFTEYGQMIGTPAYMSPEQAEMSGLDVDTRSDVYSLGVLLYELLTGTTPFDIRKLIKVGYLEMMRVIREEEPHKPSTRLSSLGESATQTAQKRRVDLKKLGMLLQGDLDWIVMKCLEKERSNRYETANGLAADINRFLRNEPVVAGPPGKIYKLHKFIKRNKTSVIAASLTGIILILGLAGTSYGLIQAKKQKTLAEQRADDLEIVSEFQAMQLRSVDPYQMGEFIRTSIIDFAPASKQVELRKTFDEINFTNISLGTLISNMLSPAFKTIEEEFKDQPHIQARLFEANAATSLRLGLPNIALIPQEKAHKILKKTLGKNHENTLLCMNQIANIKKELGQYEEAESIQKNVRKRSIKNLGKDHSTTMLITNNLAMILSAQKKYDEAKSHFNTVLKHHRRVHGNNHTDTINAINNIGFLYGKLNKHDLSEPLYRETLEGWRTIHGENHPKTISAMSNLGWSLYRQGKVQEAEPILIKTLENRRRIQGDSHPHTVMSIKNLADLKVHLNQWDEAEKLFRETLVIRRNTLGNNHPDTRLSISELALFCKFQNYLDESESLYRELLKINQSTLGINHSDSLDVMNELADLLQYREQFPEAELLYHDLLKYCQNTNRKYISNIHHVSFSLAKCLHAQGKHDDAADYYQQTLSGKREHFNEDHKNILSVKANIALLDADRGNHEAGLREIDKLLNTLTDQPEKDNILIGRFLRLQGQIYLRLGRFREAEGKLLESYEQLLKSNSEKSDNTKHTAKYLQKLYTSWHESEPDTGYDKKAEQWNEKIIARVSNIKN